MRRFSIIAAIAATLVGANLQAQGLKFSGQNVTIHERTSLDVFSLSGWTFRGAVDISFQFCSFPAARFGYIARITDAKNPGPVLNISFDGRGDDVVVRLNEEGRRSMIQMNMKKTCEYRDFVWIPVKLRIDAVRDSVYFTFGGRSSAEKFECSYDRMTPSLQFGLSGHVVDVPSFAIRDLCITDGRRKVNFPLDETDGEVIHDSKGRKTGVVKNPNWMLADAGKWKKIAEFESDSPGGVNYDDGSSTLLMYNAGEVIFLDIANEVKTIRRAANPCPMNILLGTNYLDGKKLVAYELNDWKRNNEGVSVASLDLKKMEWTAVSSHHLDGPMHHHGAFMNKFSGECTFFGGFGNMYYNGDFISLDSNGKWKVIWDEYKEGRTLFPRFFASAGLDTTGRYAFIFGGMGNESGEQIVGRRYFYDLHRVDLQTGECKRLWSLDYHGEDFVPARNLVVDGDYFYAMCYPEYLTESIMHLYRFSIKDGSFEVFSDGIKVNSDKIWCSSSLFFDRNLEKFIVATSSVDDDLIPDVSVYTLLYPPAKLAGTSYPGARKGLIIALVILLLAGAYVCIAILTKRHFRLKDEAESYARSKTDKHRRVFSQVEKPNSIYLFGDFTVTDREGNDISDNFSKQQRTLLLLLLKYKSAGLSSSRMSSILWPDKEEDKVKNSRGVAVNSLRKNLSRLEGFKIEYSGGLFSLIISEPGYCDLDELSSLEPQKGIDGMLRIISRGRFLQSITDPEFDSFKDQVESHIAPILGEDIIKRYSSGQYRASIEIADMIMAFDPLDEKALHYVVQSLLAIHRRDDALLRYASFIAEYQRTNDEIYPVKFEKI